MKQKPKIKIKKNINISKAKKDQILIENISNQKINIQLKSTGNDTLVGEQTISLKPKESAFFPSNRIYNEIINNLKKRRLIKTMISKVD
jgi:hypothetical protein